MKPTVAAATTTGPRETNQDRHFTALDRADGSWVIAVADGLSGRPRGDRAAEAAVAALPARIASTAALRQAFEDAHSEVASLAPWPGAAKGAPELCPVATLCVAAWTPDSGLIVGQMGDTLAVLVAWTDGAAEGCLLGEDLHHSHPDIMTLCLGPGVALRDCDYAGLGVMTPDLPPGGFAVVIASDGVWEALLGGRYRARHAPIDTVADRVAAACGPHDRATSGLASRVLRAAIEADLDDNATVAVANMPAPAAPPGAASPRR